MNIKGTITMKKFYYNALSNCKTHVQFVTTLRRAANTLCQEDMDDLSSVQYSLVV